MLLARKPKTQAEDELSNEILKQYDIEDEFEIASVKYLLIIDEEIVGLSKVYVKNDIGVLKYVVIRKDYIGDNLGDALLRSILNYCINNGIKTIYFSEKNSYLVKKGFSESKKQGFSLEIDLDEFFKAPCQSSKGMK